MTSGMEKDLQLKKTFQNIRITSLVKKALQYKKKKKGKTCSRT